MCQHHLPLLILTSLWSILKLLCPSWLVCFPCLSFSSCHHGQYMGHTIRLRWWWGWGYVWLPDPQHHHHYWCHLRPPPPYSRSQRLGLLPIADSPASLALLVPGNKCKALSAIMSWLSMYYIYRGQSKTMKILPLLPTPRRDLWLSRIIDFINYNWHHRHEGLWCMSECVSVTVLYFGCIFIVHIYRRHWLLHESISQTYYPLEVNRFFYKKHITVPGTFLYHKLWEATL